MDKLEYVLALAEELNLTRAASRLFISQPTLTNYINRLEDGTAQNPITLDFDCLNDMPILLSRVGSGNYRFAMQIMEHYGIVPRNTIQCDNMNLLYQLVGEGVGVLFTSAVPFMRAYAGYTEKIAFCTLPGDKALQKSYIGYLDDNPRRQLVDTFVSLMKESKSP